MAKEPVKKKKKPAAKKDPAKKPPSGTLTERMGEAKTRPYKGNRGGAVTRTEKLRVTGRQYSGDTIKMSQGNKGAVTKPKVVPLGDRPKLLSGSKANAGTFAAGNLAKGLWRGVGGPVTMLLSMTTEAGKDSDKPSGPLFSPSKNRAAGQGNPKTTNKYRPQGGGPMSRQGSSSAYMAKAKTVGVNAAPPGGPPSGAKAKAKAKSTVWGEARPGAARAMGVRKAAPVDQRKIAKDNKEAKDKKKYDNSAPVLQKKPEKKKGIFGKFKLSARGKRPQTRFQRDM